MKKIILDTNIYLNFYRLNGGQSVEMLKSLNKLLSTETFKLILPKQIEDEFTRNKNSGGVIYGDHILNFQKGLEVQLKTPHLIKSSPKIGQIKKIVEKLQALKKEAVEDYKNRVFSPSSKINQQLAQLFSRAMRPRESNEILQKAWFRTLRGNPPRKDNSSFGDAIIWETILDECVDDDLFLVSGDGDFESEIHSGVIHEFLQNEWMQNSSSKVVLYKELGSFINEQSKDKKKPIKKETIQEEERLNAAFTPVVTGGVLLSDQLRHQGIDRLFTGTTGTPLAYTVSSVIGARGCSCCGAELDHSDSLAGWDSIGASKCENCRDSFMAGKTCSKCGRHFHEGVLSASLIFAGRCSNCQSVI